MAASAGTNLPNVHLVIGVELEFDNLRGFFRPQA